MSERPSDPVAPATRSAACGVTSFRVAAEVMDEFD
jgi:hypothetical protein